MASRVVLQEQDMTVGRAWNCLVFKSNTVIEGVEP